MMISSFDLLFSLLLFLFLSINPFFPINSIFLLEILFRVASLPDKLLTLFVLLWFLLFELSYNLLLFKPVIK